MYFKYDFLNYNIVYFKPPPPPPLQYFDKTIVFEKKYEGGGGGGGGAWLYIQVTVILWLDATRNHNGLAVHNEKQW